MLLGEPVVRKNDRQEDGPALHVHLNAARFKTNVFDSAGLFRFYIYFELQGARSSLYTHFTMFALSVGLPR